MTALEPSLAVGAIFEALTKNRWPVEQAKEHVRSVPGLYAIYGDVEAWIELGFEPRSNDALYVGKSESNLVDRELKAHFAADPNIKAKTGSSTVRRSFSALLRDTLSLNAIPRNIDKPGYFTNYGLTPDGDARLTAWMHQHLMLAVWEQTEHPKQPLEYLETVVIRKWMPPINIAKNPRPSQRLRLARKEMAVEAANALSPETTSASRPYEVHSMSKSVSILPQASRSLGCTPVELAQELGKSPKTVRQILRNRYGRLPHQGDRWGVLTSEQEAYVRDRLC